jgi:hypothetical protein
MSRGAQNHFVMFRLTISNIFNIEQFGQEKSINLKFSVFGKLVIYILVIVGNPSKSKVLWRRFNNF